MEPREYEDARWSALVRAAVLLGASEADAPGIVRGVLADKRRRIRRAVDPDPLVHRALAAAIPGSERTAFGAEPELESRREMLMATDETVAAAPLGPPPRQLRQLRQPRHRRPLVIACLAAAVLLVAALVTVVTTRGAEQPGDRLRADQVPSLFGYDARSASAMLDGRGLDVTLESFPACEIKDRVIGTYPPTGATYATGDPITVYTSIPADVTCLTNYTDIEASWQFVDFLNARGSAPAFARRVVVRVDDEPGTVITDAFDLSRWTATGVSAAVRKATDRVALVADDPVTYAIPTLSVRDPEAAGGCGASDPSVAASGEAISFTIGAPADRTSCPLRVELFRHSGVIDAVVLYPALS